MRKILEFGSRQDDFLPFAFGEPAGIRSRDSIGLFSKEIDFLIIRIYH